MILADILMALEAVAPGSLAELDLVAGTRGPLSPPCFVPVDDVPEEQQYTLFFEEIG